MQNRTILSVYHFVQYHFVRIPFCTYHFVRIPFCPLPFCPVTFYNRGLPSSRVSEVQTHRSTALSVGRGSSLVDLSSCGFEYRSSRHVGTLGKSFTHSCLWHFGVKLD